MVDLPRIHLPSSSTVLQSSLQTSHKTTGRPHPSLFQAPVTSSSPKVPAQLTSTSSVDMTQLSKIIPMTFVGLVPIRVHLLARDKEWVEQTSRGGERVVCNPPLQGPPASSGSMCSLAVSCPFPFQSGPPMLLGHTCRSWAGFACTAMTTWSCAFPHVTPLPLFSWWFAQVYCLLLLSSEKVGLTTKLSYKDS